MKNRKIIESMKPNFSSWKRSTKLKTLAKLKPDRRLKTRNECENINLLTIRKYKGLLYTKILDYLKEMNKFLKTPIK